MATEGEIANHDQLITNSINTMRDAVEERTKTVERRLAELIASQPDNAALIQNRALLLAAFEDIDRIGELLPEQLAQIATDTINLQGIGERTAQDNQAESVLTSITQNELSTEITNQKATIVDGIVLAAVAGVAIDEITRQARYGVSGLMADSTDPEIRRLQRELVRLESVPAPDQTRIQSVVSELRTRFGGVARGANLRELGKRIVSNSIMNFEGAFSMGRMVRNEVKRFQYVGGVIESTRPFCEDLNGEILDEDTIRDIWSNQQWAGKAPGDPFVVRGGYNCRHWWVPVNE